MPQKLTKERAKTIATAFCSNGFHKGQALIAGGLSVSSSRQTKGLKLFDHPLVKAELAAIMRRNADICDVTVGEIIGGFLSIAFPPEGEHVNNSDRNAALANLAKYKGMFIERLAIGVVDRPSDLSEDELAVLRIQSKELTALRLKSPEIIDIDTEGT